ncbi:beta-lactamase/transpeptidase-like protein [Podospora conica]|nr:beta-lactamase/transpeptidase-like protein [Schizothecium conicum]
MFWGLSAWYSHWQQDRENTKVLDRLHQTTIHSARPICEISGVAGMSVGILHHGKVIFRDNLGLRNAHDKLPPDSQTIYGIGSLTKAFTAVALSNLLDDHPNITLDTPVDSILPDYVPEDKKLRDQVTLADFLSHRSGLSGDLSFAMQGDFETLLPKDQLLPTVSRLPTVTPIRTQWLYNNWGYAIAGAVIEKLSGKTFGTYLSESVLSPLGLHHTTFSPHSGPNSNFASPHISLRNATPLPFTTTSFFKSTFFEPSGGLHSNINDLLKWSASVLHAPNSTPILRHLPSHLTNQIPLSSPSHAFRFYGLGWSRTQLPGVVGLMGDNVDVFPVSELPILGAGAPPMVTYYHQGSAPGYYSSLFLFPSTSSAVVVLTNSLPLNDAADWLAQAYISALFDFPSPANYVSLAKESCREKIQRMDAIQPTFDEIRRTHPGDKPRFPLASYAGRYFNSAGNFFIDVRPHPGANPESSLQLRFQGRETQGYELRHLRGEVFEWSLGCDESARRGRFPEMEGGYFEVRFEVVGDGGGVGRLTWAGGVGMVRGGV